MVNQIKIRREQNSPRRIMTYARTSLEENANVPGGTLESQEYRMKKLIELKN